MSTAQKGNAFLKSLAEGPDYPGGQELSVKMMAMIKEHVSEDLANDMLYELLRQSFDPDHTRQLKLIRCGDKFINVIKEVRATTGLGLKDAKELCDKVKNGTPQLIQVPAHIGALECKRAFDAVGAYVELN